MKKLRVVLPLALIAGGLGWVAANGLGTSLVYYRTPTEVLGEATVGDQTRMGGYVVPGSRRDQGRAVRFVVTDGSTRISVLGTGGVPSLFREGRGVVVEGFYGRDGAFHADTVLIRHGSEYRPPSPGDVGGAYEAEG